MRAGNTAYTECSCSRRGPVQLRTPGLICRDCLASLCISALAFVSGQRHFCAGSLAAVEARAAGMAAESVGTHSHLRAA